MKASAVSFYSKAKVNWGCWPNASKASSRWNRKRFASVKAAINHFALVTGIGLHPRSSSMKAG